MLERGKKYGLKPIEMLQLMDYFDKKEDVKIINYHINYIKELKES